MGFGLRVCGLHAVHLGSDRVYGCLSQGYFGKLKGPKLQGLELPKVSCEPEPQKP